MKKKKNVFSFRTFQKARKIDKKNEKVGECEKSLSSFQNLEN